MLWLLGLLLVSLVVHGHDLSTPGLVDRSGRLKASDFMRLYITGALAARGQWHDLYDAETHLELGRTDIDPDLRMSGLHPNYGPTAAWVLGPLSHLPVLTAWALFSAVTVAALLIGMYALAGTLLHVSAHRGVALLAASAAPALFETVRYGQLSALTTSFFAAAAWATCRGRHATAGVILGLAFYKPHLVLPIALVAVVSRHWRLAGGIAAGVTLHLGVGVAAGGLAPTVEWFAVLARLGRQPDLIQGFTADVHSLVGFWRLLGVPRDALGSLSVASALVVLGVVAWIWSRTTSADTRWASAIVGTLLATPHLLTYDLLVLCVPLLLCLNIWLEGRIQQRWWVWLIGALYLAPLVTSPVAAATGIQISTLLMTWLLVGLMRSVRAPQPSAL